MCRFKSAWLTPSGEILWCQETEFHNEIALVHGLIEDPSNPQNREVRIAFSWTDINKIGDLSTWALTLVDEESAPCWCDQPALDAAREKMTEIVERSIIRGNVTAVSGGSWIVLPRPRVHLGALFGGRIIVARGANLRGSKLPGVNMKDSDLQDADLRDSILCRVNLTNANMQGVDLRGANLGNAIMYHADMRWANMHRTDMQGMDMREADIRGADMRDADIRGADMLAAKLEGTDLRGAFVNPDFVPPEGYENVNVRLLKKIYKEEGEDER